MYESKLEIFRVFFSLSCRVMYVQIPESMQTLVPPAERSNAHQLFKSQSARSVSVTSFVNPFVSNEMCHVLSYMKPPDLHDEHPSDNNSRFSLHFGVFPLKSGFVLQKCSRIDKTVTLTHILFLESMQ